MQTLRLRSRVGADGNLQVQLGELLANQELDIILVYRSVEGSESVEAQTEEVDPLIGLFAGSPELATDAEEKHQPQTAQSGTAANSHSTEDSLLKHFGTWEGDDIKDCLRLAVGTRTDISEVE